MLIGCALARELPLETYNAIVDSGLLERCIERRNPISVLARMLRIENQQMLDVHLQNYSKGGFGMLSQEMLSSGETVELQIDCGETSVNFRGEVRWQLANKSGYSIGCKFQSDEGYTSLEKNVETR